MTKKSVNGVSSGNFILPNLRFRNCGFHYHYVDWQTISLISSHLFGLTLAK
ncbi:MAG: hypothetical protein K8R40_03470 [Anaerolineaceae bacterium]|nr:hypothetical protein [Anaerolineaceae bacterium]